MQGYAQAICRTRFFVGLKIEVDAPGVLAAIRPCSSLTLYIPPFSLSLCLTVLPGIRMVSGVSSTSSKTTDSFLRKLSKLMTSSAKSIRRRETSPRNAYPYPRIMIMKLRELTMATSEILQRKLLPGLRITRRAAILLPPPPPPPPLILSQHLNRIIQFPPINLPRKRRTLPVVTTL